MPSRSTTRWQLQSHGPRESEPDGSAPQSNALDPRRHAGDCGSRSATPWQCARIGHPPCAENIRTLPRDSPARNLPRRAADLRNGCLRVLTGTLSEVDTPPASVRWQVASRRDPHTVAPSLYEARRARPNFNRGQLLHAINQRHEHPAPGTKHPRVHLAPSTQHPRVHLAPGTRHLALSTPTWRAYPAAAGT